jgi:hypothetical protein
MAVPVDELSAITVEETWVGGRHVNLSVSQTSA